MLLSSSASASIVYRMVGGHCTDSNRDLVFDPTLPFGGNFVVGPKLCSDDAVVELRLKDSYVPGTGFNFFGIDDLLGGSFIGESFYASDGYATFFTDFSLGSPVDLHRLAGTMPVHAGLGPLEVFWVEGWFFETGGAGTSWMLGWEFGPGDCGLGSSPGVEGEGGLCTEAGHYYSVGTFRGWRRVSEPATLTILGLGLFGLAAVRLRSR